MISSEENPRSSMGRDAVEAFLQLSQQPQQPDPQPQVQNDDVEDLVCIFQMLPLLFHDGGIFCFKMNENYLGFLFNKACVFLA